MSKINDLIKELCPKGVKYQTIGNICNFQNGYAFKSNLFKDKGDILLRITNIDGKKIDLSDVKYINISDYNTDLSSFKVNNDEIVIAMSGATTGKIGINQTNKTLYLNQRVGKLTPKNSTLNNHFLYHYLLSKVNYFYQLAGGGAQPNLSSEAIKKTLIPLPPLKVQEEIVRILDKFGKLEAELEAELEARKHQYEFWRGKLFDFKDNVEYKRLDELFPFIRNGFVGTVTSFFTEKEDGIRYLQGTNIHNGIISDNEEYYVTKEFHEKHIKNELKSDDILMVQSGHIGDCAVVGEKYKGSNCHALIIMSRGENISSKFIVHYFHTVKGYNSLTPAITGGTIKHVLAGKIGKIKVPCPPLDVQESIVNILDRFDTLVNDITVGLPAEIELRRKQYEYYRNKLLSFEELSVSE